MENELKKVTLRTINNGYTLDIENHSYMYFNKTDLLEGFMVHFGLEEEEAIDQQTIREFLDAAVVWCSEKGKSAKEIIKLMKENDALLAANEKYKRMLAAARRKNKKDVIIEEEED